MAVLSELSVCGACGLLADSSVFLGISLALSWLAASANMASEKGGGGGGGGGVGIVAGSGGAGGGGEREGDGHGEGENGFVDIKPIKFLNFSSVYRSRASLSVCSSLSRRVARQTSFSMTSQMKVLSLLVPSIFSRCLSVEMNKAAFWVWRTWLQMALKMSKWLFRSTSEGAHSSKLRSLTNESICSLIGSLSG